MENVSLSIINLRVNKETALAASQTYLNKSPPFQRAYESWDDKLKTRLIETMLLGRAMNPIWTVLNNEDDSEEVLDGMHRLSTALAFLNNEFFLNKLYLTSINGEKYHKKIFKDLESDDRAKIRNYAFIFNKLDSSYRQDLNKLRDMYEILNRSSKTLNDYEFNKVLHQQFYDIISEIKNDFIQTEFFKKIKDIRGSFESEIIEILVLLSENISSNSSWNSITSLKDEWLIKNLGDTAESVNKFVITEKTNILETFKLINKFTIIFNSEDLFSKDKRTFNKYYLPYKFIISRCGTHIKNISLFNRHYKNLIEKFKNEITTVDISLKLGCNSRNAIFQKKLITLIDNIILEELSKNRPRCFSKSMISQKLLEQKNLCNVCNNIIISSDEYHGDHIKSWTSGGETVPDNLQVLHKRCHELKHNS
jgi:hypothetical protein